MVKNKNIWDVFESIWGIAWLIASPKRFVKTFTFGFIQYGLITTAINLKINLNLINPEQINGAPIAFIGNIPKLRKLNPFEDNFLEKLTIQHLPRKYSRRGIF